MALCGWIWAFAYVLLCVWFKKEKKGGNVFKKFYFKML